MFISSVLCCCKRNVELEELKDAVCLIESVDQAGDKFTGTGFHYGDGWVMTAAHNFQDNKKDNETSHSYLSEGNFRVLFHVGGKKYEFLEHKRTAFVHHLKTGKKPDFKNKDIGMVKLGVQYHGNENPPDWEDKERKQLIEMKAVAFSKIDRPVHGAGDDVYAIYYGDAGSTVQKMKIKRTSEKEINKVPMLHLEKKAGVLPEGASGCPVLLERDGKYHLVGLHFSGTPDKKDGEAQALWWKNGIGEYLQQGVNVIGAVGPYLINKALADKESKPEMRKSFEEEAEIYKESLKSISKSGKLTIYLINGEIITYDTVGSQ